MNTLDKQALADIAGLINELLPHSTPRIAALILRQTNGALEEISNRLATLAEMEELDKQSLSHIAKNEMHG